MFPGIPARGGQDRDLFVTFPRRRRIVERYSHMPDHETQYREWMIAALSGNKVAYSALLAALTRHLRGYFARRLDPATTEDAVQETLIAIHTRRATYDPDRPFTAWVHGIARYKLIDEFRKMKHGAQIPLDQAPDLFAHDESEAALARRDVAKLLDRLPEAKRTMMQQVKLDGRSISDVAARNGMSETSVKVTVHRALKFLSDGVGDADR